MNADRPDPDLLLAEVESEAVKARRGKLKIFFGAAPGVGKTYTMLEVARARKREGVDVVAGYIEAHERPETIALLEGLEQLPARKLTVGSAARREFDLDAALARKPTLLLVDELAHTNAPGSRHPKRWQDIEELLDAGINIYTTVNVQHLESLNDLVRQVTGIQVRETVPDEVVERADEIELVDLPPEDLLKRLSEGKVYVPDQARHAIENFFRRGNLLALRELALNRTARHVDADMRDYRREHLVERGWPVVERIRVCVVPGSLAVKLVRAAKRLADVLQAEWIALYVETPDRLRLPEAERNAILSVLKLAETLGGEAVTVPGSERFSETVLEFARSRNVSRIMIGKPGRSGWKRFLLGSIVDALIQDAGEIEIQIVSEQAAERSAATQNPFFTRTLSYLGLDEKRDARRRRKRADYAWAVAITALATGASALLFGRFAPANLVMVFLLGVVITAIRFGRGPGVLASLLSVLAFDFFFIPPYFSFAVSDTQYVLTFAVMLAVAITVSSLAANVRLQARVAVHRERRTTALFALTKELSATRDLSEIMRIGVRHLTATFECQATILLPDERGKIQYPREFGVYGSLHGADLGVAQWVFDHGQPAGRGTQTLPGAEALYLSLQSGKNRIGVLAVLPAEQRRVFNPEQMRLLETFAAQIASAIERVNLAAAAQKMELKANDESVRNSLLAGISHDLRTPLAVIAGSASSLVQGGEKIGHDRRISLARNILDEATHMNEVVSNLLDMTRLAYGAKALRREWSSIAELVGSALHRLDERAKNHVINVGIENSLPLVQLDAALIEQVFVNVIENALKYTAEGSQIQITAQAESDVINIRIADDGPGFPSQMESRVFDKFYRGHEQDSHGGVGLGLTLAKAIIEAHGGSIVARNRSQGGAEIVFTVPLEKTQPSVEIEP